ncbi:DUF938 domain-containing protein [Magnetospirillum sulfuroxidans]|uniref:DUF938 domain-containing protein n=1 Tax=Magnetospirillum sulfuroxidans TaxID=611300 RepID=A0ABS5IEK4_9PROT|nr:DUF938 domain-containing protein [Magnetospirillum sulfuroxidans]MBR9972847.1 DUF938 domain-containing protein [Magnetospirillum sulfuroxidans]
MKRHYPATGRNRGPILDALRPWLPPEGVVLEIASGSGEHACWFTSQVPGLRWQPSDGDPDCLGSIAAWRHDEGLTDRIAPPLLLDVAQLPWPVESADMVFCANMIHISPWESCVGLMEGAGRILPAGGILAVYGPFKRGGQSAPSNTAFDADLRSRDPRWGVRDLEAVDALAQAAGLELQDTIAMPANNLSVVWRKRP